MDLYKNPLTALAILLALSISGPSPASDRISSADIAKLCRAHLQDADSADGRFCAAYVRGFIDGSPIVVFKKKPVVTARATESFGQRATRTRLGRMVAPRPEYCIDDSVGMTRLVRQIVAVADERPPRNFVDAEVLLYATFQRFYKCVA